jgi:predicted Zn-dependent protease
LAISSVGQNIATRNVLSYSRDFENAADTGAIDVLKDIDISPRGLIKILRKLVMKQKISGDIVDKYLLTHPVSEDRINYLENAIKQHPEIDKKTPQAMEDEFKMVRAKFYGYLAEPRKTRSMYAGKTSDDAIYALSIAYNKEARFEEADKLLNQLISKDPTNPYLQENKRGQ